MFLIGTNDYRICIFQFGSQQMPNNIVDELIEERIDIFRSAFSQRAKVLFQDDEKYNRLMHPGEFGTYREGITRDFLQSFLPQHLAIGTGFIVNALKDVSGQIDIVIYDPSLTPPLESKNRQKFFPMETVIAVGEIKSDVDKGQFKGALLRLAKIKKMRSSSSNETTAINRWYRLGKTKYSPNKISLDQVFTFLICNRINFQFQGDTISSTLNEIYKSVDYEHRHSAVLSLEDGLFFYMDTDNETCSFPISTTGIENNRNYWIYSHDNEYAHFKRFCSDLFMHAALCTVGYVNLLKYANFGNNKMNHWIEKTKPNE